MGESLHPWRTRTVNHFGSRPHLNYVDLDKWDDRWDAITDRVRHIRRKSKHAWEQFCFYLTILFCIAVVGFIPWMIHFIWVHPSDLKAVKHNLWHQAIWAFAVYVLTKVWQLFKGDKRERAQVQSSEPQSWGRNHGGIKGRGERHGSDTSV